MRVGAAPLNMNHMRIQLNLKHEFFRLNIPQNEFLVQRRLCNHFLFLRLPPQRGDITVAERK